MRNTSATAKSRGAASIATTHKEPTAAECDEIDALVAELPDEAKYLGLVVLADSIDGCGRPDAQSIYEAITALDDPRAWAWTVRMRADDGKNVSADIPRLLAEFPSSAYPVALSTDMRRGKAIKANRKALVATVKPWLEADDLPHLQAAFSVFRVIPNPLGVIATRRLEELDPRQERRPYPATRRELFYLIDAANRRPSADLALADLDALIKKMPESGEIRATWQQTRYRRLKELGRSEEAYEALKDAARADPDSGQTANTWGHAAANRGVDLEAALDAIERALANREAPIHDRNSYYTFEQFADTQRRISSGWEHTRGWLLCRLGRYDEAIDSLTGAAIHRDNPSLQAHLGLAWLGKGDGQAAYVHLKLAASSELEPELAEQVRTELAALHPHYGALTTDPEVLTITTNSRLSDGRKNLLSSRNPALRHTFWARPLNAAMVTRRGVFGCRAATSRTTRCTKPGPAPFPVRSGRSPTPMSMAVEE